MRTDSEVERDVRSELHWSPDIDTKDVAAKVRDGVVTLTGYARNYFEKYEIERAAKRVAGVIGVANDIEARSLREDAPTDPQLAREIVKTIKRELPALVDSIKAIVNQGHVTLEGNSQHLYLRNQAECLLRKLPGVKGITNDIVVRTRAEPQEVKSKIEQAFRRSADLDSAAVSVEADGGVITLTGEVRSWFEHEEAQRTAAAAPGVTEVRNKISVLP